MAEYANLDQEKMAVLKSLRGKATRAQELYGTSTDEYNAAATWDKYIARIWSVLLPQAESNMSRIEFESRKQGLSEPITCYIAEKMALLSSYNLTES